MRALTHSAAVMLKYRSVSPSGLMLSWMFQQVRHQKPLWKRLDPTVSCRSQPRLYQTRFILTGRL